MKGYLKFIVTPILLGSVIVSFNACSAKNEISPKKKAEIALFKAEDIRDQIQKVKTADEVDNLIFFAPISFKKAEDLAYTALEMQQATKSMTEIYDVIQKSKQFLTKAYNTKKLVKKELSTVLDYKEKLDLLHASKLFKEKYESINSNILTMIKDVDEGEGIDAFDSRDDTLREARELFSELKISSNLHLVKEIIENMDDELAPALFQKAKSTYEKAKFTINKFPDNDELITKVSQEALNSALYAQVIAHESKKIMHLKDENIEFYISNIHNHLIEIYKEIEESDKFSTISIESKLNRIKKQISEIIENNKNLVLTNQELTTDKENSVTLKNELNSKIEELSTTNSSLKTQVDTANIDMLKSKNAELILQKTIAELKDRIGLITKEQDKVNSELANTEVVKSEIKDSKEKLNDLQVEEKKVTDNEK